MKKTAGSEFREKIELDEKPRQSMIDEIMNIKQKLTTDMSPKERMLFKHMEDKRRLSIARR